MDVKRRIIQAIAVATVLGISGVASADIFTFTDRASWTAAVAATDFTADFESFVTDTSFASAPLNVGPFTLSTNGVAEADTNLVDALVVPPMPPSLGNAAASFFVQDPLSADLTFTTPVRGFFADFLFAGNTQQLDLLLSFSGGGSADVLVPGPGVGLEPFGFISTTDTVTAIRFNNSVNDGFSVDNISGAVQLEAVPEATSLTLLFLGSMALVACHRGTRRTLKSLANLFVAK